MSSNEADVIIVGGGPTGLLLAGDLAAAGVACVVLERRDEQSNLTRAFAVHARTLEVLDARGLADELMATGQIVSELCLFGDVRVDLSRLDSRFAFALITPQYHTEDVLRRYAESSGAKLISGAEVVDVKQTSDSAEVRIGNGNGHWQASYVVGADGVHSTARRALGMPFPGRSAVKSVMLADVRLDDPPAETLVVDSVEAGFAFVTSFGDGWHRVIAWDRHDQKPDDAPVELDAVRRITEKVFGTDFGMAETRWLSRFHSDERQVPSYRAGRVFLAGDAAHVHSPAGGQGMNTGLQDSANLSWKLAFLMKGAAAPGLLDTYQEERWPVGHRVLRTSDALLRAGMMHNAALRRIRNSGLKAVTAIRPLNDRMARTIAALDVTYPRNSVPGRLIGHRAPDLRLATNPHGQTRLYEALRDREFVYLGPPPGAAEPVPAAVRCYSPALGEPQDAMLVRPDGYIAWSVPAGDVSRRIGGLARALDALGIATS